MAWANPPRDDELTFAEYSREAAKTAQYPGDSVARVSYCVLGLAGEGGELANTWKKLFRDDGGMLTDERRAKMLAEASDCLWYLDRLVVELGSTLDEVARQNVSKLADRAARGVICGSGDDR